MSTQSVREPNRWAVLAAAAQVHGDTTALWWAVGIFGLGFLLVLLIVPSGCEAGRATTLTALARNAIGNCHHDELAAEADVTERPASAEPALAP